MLLIVIGAVYASCWLSDHSGSEAVVMGAGRRISDALNDYQYNRGSFPVELMDAREYIKRGGYYFAFTIADANRERRVSRTQWDGVFSSIAPPAVGVTVINAETVAKS